MIGEPDIIPLSFKNAIIDPEKVIAPTAAPMDISIKLASFIFLNPCLNVFLICLCLNAAVFRDMIF